MYPNMRAVYQFCYKGNTICITKSLLLGPFTASVIGYFMKRAVILQSTGMTFHTVQLTVDWDTPKRSAIFSSNDPVADNLKVSSNFIFNKNAVPFSVKRNISKSSRDACKQNRSIPNIKFWSRLKPVSTVSRITLCLKASIYHAKLF